MSEPDDPQPGVRPGGGPLEHRPAPGAHAAPARTSRGRVSRLLRRALSLLAVLTSFTVLAASGGGYLLVHHYDRRVDRIPDVFSDAASQTRPEPGPSKDARTILIVGSDSRGDLGEGQGTQGRGDAFVTGQRSDTMILAHLYGGRDTAQLVSFPRDSWVTIPARTSADTGEPVPEGEAKLNRAFYDGGPQLLIRTLEGLTGLRIDHYVQIDFDGFQSMVSALGGVEVCLSEPAQDEDSGIDLPAGRQTISGDQALAFVRQRNGLPGGDLGRIGRQQQFIGAIVRKTLSAGTLLNPFRLNGVLSVATESVQVDESLDIDELRELAMRFRDFEPGGVLFSTVPVSDPDARRGEELVVLLDQARAEVVFDELRRDVPPSPPPPGTPTRPLIVAPEDVRVRLFNGAGVKGLAARAADDLAAVGFVVVGTPSDRGTGAGPTTVHHGPDRADSARTVAAAIPGSRTRLDPALTGTLDVVVGTSYTRAVPVEVAPQPRSSAPAVTTAAGDPCAP